MNKDVSKVLINTFETLLLSVIHIDIVSYFLLQIMLLTLSLSFPFFDKRKVPNYDFLYRNLSIKATASRQQPLPHLIKLVLDLELNHRDLLVQQKDAIIRP